MPLDREFNERADELLFFLMSMCNDLISDGQEFTLRWEQKKLEFRKYLRELLESK